jgi:hypothetical protein
MNQRYIFGLLAVAAMFLSLGSRNPSNPPLANTGAPGETTCQKSGCHNGGSFSANVSVDGLPDSIFAGQTYTFQLKSTNNTSSRGGFQMTCLDLDNQPCGTFAATTGVNVASLSGRSYARQSTPQNVAANLTLWDIKWTAPNTEVGGRFYVSHLLANGDGDINGDNVVTATYNFEVSLPVSTDDALRQSLRVYPTTAQDLLTLNWAAGENGQADIIDLQGKVVSSQNVQSGMAFRVTNLPQGMYFVKLKTAKGETSQKFIKL